MTTLACCSPPETALAEDEVASPTVQRPAIRPLRADEDWTPLSDARLHTQSFDRLKFLKLSPETSLTLGGEARLRFESYDPVDLGLNAAGLNDYALLRLMLHGDLRWGKGVRAFVQLRSGDSHDAERRLAPTQENAVDVNQAFVQFDAAREHGSAALRLGRQELTFGSGRMISPREGPNVRVSFDGARVLLTDGDDRRLDVFYTRPVQPEFQPFDDRSSESSAFWGVYGTAPAAPGSAMDLYYFGIDRARIAFAQGIGSQTRHAIGARLFGKADGWDWDLEAAYQFGTFGDADISAYTSANEVGYTLQTMPWSPRLGLRLDLASGDDDLAEGRLGTFEAPFPRLPYLTEPNFVAPSNLIDVHPTLTLRPNPALRLSLDYVAVWRHREADAVYLPPLRPVATGSTGGRFVQQIAQVSGRWDISPQLSLDAAFARAFVGETLASGGARDSDFSLVSLTARF